MNNNTSIHVPNIYEKPMTYIIAEAGVNHNGDINLAFKLIEEAKKSGANCIKFQTFSTDYSESKYSLKPSYFDGRDGGVSKYDFSRSLEFDKTQFLELKQYCDFIGIDFLSMAADIPSLEMLIDIGVSRVKIGSSDSLNFPLFKAIGESGMSVIYSTGISTLDDIKEGVSYLYKCGVKDLSILQCTSQYPSPYQEINLKVMDTYKELFNIPVGLSDHSKGIHIPFAAVARGANIIEKHFTLDRSLPGVDHAASIEPSEFKEMVDRIREIELAIGDGVKRISESEKEHLMSMRKSIFSLKQIKKGDVFTMNNIGSKRPGGGILPVEIDKILGKKSILDINEDEFITWEMVDQ